MSGKKIVEGARHTEVGGEYDALVLGGGPAGVAALIAAARAGARALLIEKHGFLGGMATAGMVGSLCGFFTTGPEKKAIIGGVAEDFLKLLKSRQGVSEKMASKVDPRIAVYQYSPEVFKYAADRLVLQSGADLLFHTLVVEVLWEVEGSRLAGVIVENKSGRRAYLARVIVDATGDGDVASKAGAPFEFGDGKGRAQSLTTIFRMTNVDPDKLRILDRQLLRTRMVEARRDGTFRLTRVDPIIGPAIPTGLVSANLTGIPDLNALDAVDLTKAELEGRRQVFEYLDFLRDTTPGFERAEISSIAPQVGVRETRRILGEYVLGEREALEGQKFDDAIALGAWPVEFHDPATGKIQWKFLETDDDYYTIPLRCLIPLKVDNVVMAGRCISTTHIAQASTRVIGPSLATGEAAGVLAARSVDSDTPPRMVPAEIVQRELRRSGAILEA